MLVKVTTITLADNSLHDERTVRLNSVAGQRWLINHMTWAFKNNRGVQMHNVEDAPPCLN